MMIRAILRLLSMIALAIAVIMTVLDATRSIAADALVMTPLGVSWSAVSPDTLDRLRQAAANDLPAFVGDFVLAGLLQVPGFAVFAALAILLAAAGRRPQRPAMRFGLQR